MANLLTLWDRNLGARDIDFAMLHFYRETMIKSKGVDLFESKKAIMRTTEAI